MKKILVFFVILLSFPFIIYFVFPGLVYQSVTLLARYSSGLEKRSIVLDGERIVYLEGGTGEDVVLLHGFGSEKDIWLLFAKNMKGYHLVIPDLPGYGESEKSLKGVYTIKAQAKRVVSLADALKIDNFHIAGNSMGGNIAGRVAADFPSRVKTLLLMDSAGVMTPVDSELFRELKRGRNPLIPSDREGYRKLVEFVYKKKPYIPSQIERYLADKFVLQKTQLEKNFGDMLSDSLELQNDLKKIKSPTLIMWGDSDRLLDISSVGIFRKGIVGSKSVIISGCGHAPMSEEPLRSAEEYKRFLKETGVTK